MASPGVRQVHSQVATYASAWDLANESALAEGVPGLLWVVLGDSTAQGIGAHGHEHGYVGQVRQTLQERSGQSWRVLNLSKSGARAEHVVQVQLPRLRSLTTKPDLVTCAIGANDLVRRTPPALFTELLTTIIDSLPEGAIVATLPRGLRPAVATEMNTHIRKEAERAGLAVADVWTHTEGPWQGRLAADGFHPNAKGYEAWANAFVDALDATPASRPWSA